MTFLYLKSTIYTGSQYFLIHYTKKEGFLYERKVCLILFLILGSNYFRLYLQRQIYEERTMQLNEITSQVRTNLDTAPDNQ